MMVIDQLHYIATFTPSRDPYYLRNSWLAWRKSRSGRFREHNSRCNTKTPSPQPVHCTDYPDPSHYAYPLKFQRHLTYVHCRVNSLAEKFLRQAWGRELIDDTPFTQGGREGGREVHVYCLHCDRLHIHSATKELMRL
jgi:hypothetical protein